MWRMILGVLLLNACASSNASDPWAVGDVGAEVGVPTDLGSTDATNADGGADSGVGEPPVTDVGVADVGGEHEDGGLILDAAVGLDATVELDAAIQPDAEVVDAAPSARFVSMLPDPGLLNPRLQFHTGGVANNAPEIFETVPDMPGYAVSAWFVAQWAKTFPGEPEGTGLMRPEVMFRDAPSTEDPLYGVAEWAFPGGVDNRSHLWIYANGGQPVYELYSEHGWLSPEGGSNVFLSARARADVDQTMDRPVTLRFSTKLKSQTAHYTDDDAARDGAVMWQYFSGLIFQYSGEGAPMTLFMQIRHGQSTRGGRYMFAPNDQSLVYGYALPGDPQLTEASAPEAGLEALRLDVNAYLCDAIHGAYPRAAGGDHLTLPAAALDPSAWRFNSFYIGLETQSGRLEDGVYRGAAAARVLISDLHLERDEQGAAPGCP